jgi:hypothetical protein
MRTPTGDYRIDYFNKCGERIAGISIIEKCLTSAIEVAQDPWPIPTYGAASFTVMRCVLNSLDKGVEYVGLLTTPPLFFSSIIKE